MANLVFYPYQLEDGSYIDKVSGKKFSTNGYIPTYPANDDLTPYKTPKDYLGGGECIKKMITLENHSYILKTMC